jgi:predicted MFS family arabinose efflux permease
VLVGYFGDRFGRRRAMVAFGLTMSLAGLILAVAPSFHIALIALFFGAMSPTGTEVSPFLSIEQSIVAEVAKAGKRTRAFAVYNLSGTLSAAVGALASGIPTLLAGGAPTSPDPLRPMFAVYSVLGLVAAALSRMLPAQVEIGQKPSKVSLSPRSRSRITRMSSLFAVDAFAGGFVLQSFISLWFYNVYPESRDILGPIFFVAGILTAFSFLLAARLGERFGLLETMVFSHIPSSVFLILMPIVPGFHFALAIYLCRMSVSQMDVPTRQAYLAGIVAREERTAANAATNTARNVAQAIGPFSSAAILQSLGLATAFFIGGGLKICYDIATYATFRNVRPQSS